MRACPKNAFHQIYVTICGRFCPDGGVVAGYVSRIRAKYTIKWGDTGNETIFRHAILPLPDIPYNHLSLHTWKI
ncbi:MAG: DUF6783 domain-containing protein [Blautia wexlerae]